MGQQIIMQTLRYPYTLDDNEVYRLFQNQLKFKQQLNQGVLTQTAIVSIDKSLFVLRSFSKPQQQSTTDEVEVFEASLTRYKHIRDAIIGGQQQEQQQHKYAMLHVTPILDIIETPNVVFVLRQYYYYNLKERMYKLPYLTYTEKLWIIFQLLLAVCELHERGIIHGDIKVENIMLTSNGSLFLTDIASYKSAYIPIDNSTVYTYYFGSTNQSVKTCNVAPERFIEKNALSTSDITTNTANSSKTVKMDVFSLGCVIAELLLEEYLFDYTKLLEYKNGKVDITPTLSKINDVNLRELITNMLKVDPSERIGLNECMQIFSGTICPIAIPRALIHFNTLITKTSFWQPDMIVGIIYKHWRQIWKLCYGEFNENNIPILYNKYNFTYINKLSLTSEFKQVTAQFDNTPMLNQFKFIFNTESCTMLVNEDEYKTNSNNVFKEKNNEATALLFINYILLNLPFARCESTKILGMEMLKCFAKKLSDLEKIQVIVPYFIPMLTVNNSFTRFTALHYLIDILYFINFDELVVTPLDFKFFYEYLSPALFKLVDEGSSMLIIEFLRALESIIDLELQFRDVESRSRLAELAKKRTTTIGRYDSSIQHEPNSETKVDDGDSDSKAATTLMQCATLPEDKNILEQREVKKLCDELIRKFKQGLFRAIQNLFNIQDDIDVLQILIRKLPTLLTYYGSEKDDEIFCFCINIFNKKEWILLKEMLTVFPEMLDKFNQSKNYRSDLLNCIEMVILQNANEHIIYELIQVLSDLFTNKKKTALSIKTFIPLFKQLLPFQLHPNTRIRDDIIALTLDFVSQLNPIETFIYVYKKFIPFLEIPVPYITKDKIQMYLKPHICRTLFELHLGKYPSLSPAHTEILNDSGNAALFEVILEAKSLCALFQMPNMNNDDDDSNNNSSNSDDITDPENYCFNIREYKSHKKHKCKTLNTVDSLLQLYQSYEGFEKEDEESYKFFLEKVLGICEVAHGVDFPKYCNNTDIPFEADYMGFGWKDFAGFLIVKKFNISIKLGLLNVIFEDQSEQSTMLTKITHRSFQISDSYLHWRPQGQLISTITEHKDIPIEKVIPLNANSFMSIDSKGDAYVWKITTEDGNTFNVGREWKVINEEYPITFNSTISNGDNNKLIFASKHKLVQYQQPESFEGIPSVLLEMKDESNYITSTCTFEKSSQAKLSVLFSTVDCMLNIYDPRMEKVALRCELPKERGIVSCITRGFDEQTMNIGTLGGYIMKYDARLNTFSSSMQYQNNKPIVGISSYLPSKRLIKDKTSSSSHNEYLIIWTGSDEHDIALWNTYQIKGNIITPSIIFRTNIMFSNEQDNDVNLIDIPEITRVNDSILPQSNEAQIITAIKRLSELSWTKYNSSEYMKLVMHRIQQDFYERTEHCVWNSKYVYNNISSVQCALSPFLSMNMDNPLYILSAGNDKTIRYWDISNEWLYGDVRKKDNVGSYIVNAPSTLNTCRFTKTECEGTLIIQSDEVYYKDSAMKEQCVSEYQNVNGRFGIRNADDDETMMYLRNADAAHRNIITSILPMSFGIDSDGCGNSNSNNKVNLLLSSSWDGSIKIWK